MYDTEDLLSLVGSTRLLISRLERLSADSRWAHRASGLRGSLLSSLEQLENSLHQPGSSDDPQLVLSLQNLNQQGNTILVSAAREIRVPERPSTP